MSDSLIDIKDKSCAFTGHRKLGKGFNLSLLEEKVEEFINEGIESFYCGMAAGFDLIAAGVVLNLKLTYPHIKLIACIPCPEQERYYSAEEKKKYREVLGSCDKVELVNDSYFNGCMLVRDRFMVNNCDRVLAYLDDRNEGGTAYTVRYAQSKNKSVFLI